MLRTARAPRRARALLECLCALEEREHIRVAPARTSSGRPSIEVGGVAANPQHPVDRAATADHASAAPAVDDAASRRVGLCYVAPVVFLRQLERARRNS